MMWHQYLKEVDNASVHADAAQNASIRSSLRRMSHAVLVQGAAVVPDEREVAMQANGMQDVKEEDGEKSLVRTLISFGNTIVIFLVAVGYPTFILPYYRADSTTEYVILASHKREAINTDEEIYN